MKKLLLLVLCSTLISWSFAGNVVKTYNFKDYKLASSGIYTTVSFEGTKISGIPGEPSLPYQPVSLLLPPGEFATSIDIICSDLKEIPGTYVLYPLQYAQPVSEAKHQPFFKNEAVYSLNGKYPSETAGKLMTSYMNGYSFALTTFTPVIYNPATGKLSYYEKVTLSVSTSSDRKSNAALENLGSSKNILTRVRQLAQNPEMATSYPEKEISRTAYQMLIITSGYLQSGFDDLISYYATIGITAQTVTTDYIYSNVAGIDQQDKIRNYIIQEYQNNDIEYVLLGGDIDQVPYRGFYCYVISGGGYEDNNIPADIYFSGLDGNWNTNNDNRYAEPGEEDALPDISVARFPVSTTGELEAMVHKTISYQNNPVEGEWKEPYLVGENLYDDPLTFGSDYLELIVDNHNDNGYTTFGIPSAQNSITRLYDTLVSPPNNYYQWSTQDVIDGINQGKTFIHHVGHSNEIYMMRLYVTDITDANFSMVNGIDHNYTLMYSHGCICGAFDFNDCIAERAVTINNFLVGGVFNSRYGWFNQGTSDGPSEHIHREFISAMYNDTVPETHLGTAHMISKAKTAPFLSLPGEFEPGAQRWCFYDCNAFGDPALKIWTEAPSGVGVPRTTDGIEWSVYPVPANDHVNISVIAKTITNIRVVLTDELGKERQLMERKNLGSGKQSFTVSLEGIEPGAYLCRMETSEGVSVKKIIVVR